MKKPLLLFSILVTGAFIFSSCNKNLKDDIKDLQQEVDSLNKHNSELDEKVRSIEDAIGSNEPIVVTSSFVDDEGKTRTRKDNYRFKSSGYSTHSLRELSDGTYDVYIERFNDVNWFEGAYVAFNYNPATKAVTNKRSTHYWDDYSPYGDRCRYDETIYTGSDQTINLNLKSINLTTGEIALDFSASAKGDYTNNYYSNCPNPGEAMNTSFSFAGKLKIFPFEEY